MCINQVEEKNSREMDGLDKKKGITDIIYRIKPLKWLETGVWQKYNSGQYVDRNGQKLHLGMKNRYSLSKNG